MKNARFAILFYFLVFLYLFFFTLNFNYVEGDDAATILYHLCGRNPAIQQPYAPYNSGMDFIIAHSGLQGEEALRTFAVSVSFVSGFLIFALFALLLETLFKDSEMVTARQRLYFYLLLPFVLPDMIFHSLILNSANPSFVFLLASLLLFVRFLRKENYPALIGSMVFFALSVPFRWTMLVALPLYAGLFFYWHPLRNYPRDMWLLLFKILVSNLGGLLLALLFIGVTGYDWNDILATVTSTTGYMETTEVSALSLVASASAFLTPSLLLLLLFALFKMAILYRSDKPAMIGILGLLLLSVSPFVLLGFYPFYKYSMTLLPVLLALALLGFGYLKDKKILTGVFVAAVVLPWFIGIQIDAAGTFCGPGFEMGQKITSDHVLKNEGKNPDNRVKIEKIKPVFDSGFYMPMPEGPRPLYGYFYVLAAGKWKSQIDAFTNERETLYAFLTRHKNAVYYQDRMSSYFSCDLYRKGFTAKTGYMELKSGSYRSFTKGKESIAINIVPDANKTEWIVGYFNQNPDRPIVFRSSYSNDILKLGASKNARILGPFTAIMER